MSVVVFDGFDIVGDRYLGHGSMIYDIHKVGETDHFFYGFVGAPSVAQMMVAKLQDEWGQPGYYMRLNEWSLGISDRTAKDDVAELLVIPKQGDDMFYWYIGLPIDRMTKQPYYLGYRDGYGLFNYCRALQNGKPFARDCVGMCITASAVSNDPYAVGPFDVLTVNPVEALQG